VTELVTSYFEPDWCDLIWTDWIELKSRSKERAIIPREQGVYRVRAEGYDGLIYVGQTNELKRRTGALARHTDKIEMPWNDPHTAAPNLWAWKDDKNWKYEVSIATTKLSRQNRMALECLLLWSYRLEKGESTLCNHGRFHPDYIKSSDKSANRRGRKLGKKEDRNSSWGPSYPPLTPWKSYLSENWMKLAWNEFQLISEQQDVPSKSGIYKIINTKTQELQYIGESKNLNNRLFNHKQRFPRAQFSYIETTSSIPKYQRLEIENDLIGHYYEQNRLAPRNQFLRGTGKER